MHETVVNEVLTAGHRVSAVTFVRSQFDRGTLPWQQLLAWLPNAVRISKTKTMEQGLRGPLVLPTAPTSPPPLPSLPVCILSCRLSKLPPGAVSAFHALPGSPSPTWTATICPLRHTSVTASRKPSGTPSMVHEIPQDSLRSDSSPVQRRQE